MKPIVLFIVLFLAFIASDDVLAAVGYPHLDFTSSFVFRLHPLTYLSFFLVAYYLKTGQLKVSEFFTKYKSETYFLIVCLLLIVYLRIMGNLTAFSFLLDALCLPAILSILLAITDKKIFPKFRVLVYIFFFINAALAIIEKILGKSLLNDGTFDFKDYFRATALYGHPLNNALIMSALTVILFFATKKEVLKITVLIIGLLSIFCFGARGALIGVFLTILINVIVTFLNLKKNRTTDVAEKNKMIKDAKIEMGYLLGFVVLSLLVMNFTGLGDRIAAVSYMDNSAETRVNAFTVLRDINFSDLLLGFGTNEIEHFQHNSGLDEIENFWIIWLLRFGLIATIVLAVFLLRFLYNMLGFVSTNLKLTFLFVFWFVASTNNSLSTNTMALPIFVLTCYIFYDSKERVRKKKRS